MSYFRLHAVSINNGIVSDYLECYNIDYCNVGIESYNIDIFNNTRVKLESDKCIEETTNRLFTKGGMCVFQELKQIARTFYLS